GAQRDPFVEGWLDVEVVWQPLPTSRHGEVLGRLTREHSLTANLIPDAHLAALAIAHGLTVCSANGDFAVLGPEVSWYNPLQGAS
ncbi:MAG: VapC toxin family PIN domain ribonuclease, partial [Acidimicrobiales bacterium]